MTYQDKTSKALVNLQQRLAALEGLHTDRVKIGPPNLFGTMNDEIEIWLALGQDRPLPKALARDKRAVDLEIYVMIKADPGSSTERTLQLREAAHPIRNEMLNAIHDKCGNTSPITESGRGVDHMIFPSQVKYDRMAMSLAYELKHDRLS